jgi:hypothetical protein
MIAEHVAWTVDVNDGGRSFRWGRIGEDVVAEWAGVLSLVADRRGELKALRVAPDASEEIAEKVRLGAATAFLRAQRHQQSLHASAVALRGQAIVCVGASGDGKSTLAHALCERAGAELLADDVAMVERLSNDDLLIVPSERTLWLGPDGSGAKAAIAARSVASDPVPIAWLVALSFDENVTTPAIRPIRGADAVSAIVPSLIRFEASASQWERELQLVHRLLAQVTMAGAVRSRKTGVDVVADALLHFLAEGSR